jgi:hypothetical protein
MHGITHVPGGPDPVPGLLPGLGGDYPTVVAQIGSLVAYWRLGETLAPFLDTSGYDAGAPANLDRHVNGVAMSLHLAGALPAGEDDGAIGQNYAGTTSSTNTDADWLEGTAGADGRFNFDTSTGLGVEMSAAAWVKPAASGNSWTGGIVGACELAAGTPSYPAGWALYLVWPTLELIFYRGGTTSADQQELSGGVLPAGEWTHAAASYDGAEMRVYVNGGLAASAASTFDLGHNNFAATVGNLAVKKTPSGDYRGRFYGQVDEAAVWAKALSPTEAAALHIAAGGGAGSVLVTDDDGNPVWLPPSGAGLVLGTGADGHPAWVAPPAPAVEVNGSSSPAAFTPTPTPPPPPRPEHGEPPPDPDVEWIEDQPFVGGGGTFVVQPRTWTTIPFTTPHMVRISNVTGITDSVDIPVTDPDAGGWLHNDFPHGIIVAHDIPFQTLDSVMQVCLRIDSPRVEPETSDRALRIFETTHQKTVLMAYSETAGGCCDEGGQINVAKGSGDGFFSHGDTGGFDNGNHDDIFFVPNYGLAYQEQGFDWLPGGMLKQGMRLIAQCWHSASVPLTFSCVAGATYAPHLVLDVMIDGADTASWGPPWSTWYD